jgi:hypothetical protein
VFALSEPPWIAIHLNGYFGSLLSSFPGPQRLKNKVPTLTFR